jgi:hypothetical protein
MRVWPGVFKAVAVSLACGSMFTATLVMGAISRTINIPSGRYAAYTVPDPGDDLQLDLVADAGVKITDSWVEVADGSDDVLWQRTLKTEAKHTYNIGLVLSSREWVWIRGEYQKPGGGGIAGLPPKFDAMVPGVDIDVEGVEEDAEESAGAVLCVSNGMKTVTIRKVEPTSRFPSASVLLEGGSGRVKVWQNANKTGLVTLPKTFAASELPRTLWLEPVSASASVRDTELKVSYTCPNGSRTEDKVKLTILKVAIDPTWDIITEGDDSEDFKAVVTPAGLSGLTYAWSWQPIIANGGNNPAVTFSAPNATITHVDQAHWYAVPDARCASNQVSEYRLWCAVSIGGANCSNSAALSVQLVDPGAETVPEYEITGGPSIAFNAASNWWYVSGVGTMARQVTLTTNWWLHANSEFTAKLQAHENQHSQDLVNGFDGHTFVTVPELYARISPFTNPTSTGLVSKINQELELYKADELAELVSLVDGLEVRAYNVSDGVAPDYYYSNCGRFIYP